MNSVECPGAATDLSRRNFLISSLFLSAVATGTFVSGFSPAFAQPASAFQKLSEFLTGKQISAELAARASEALVKVDPSMSQRLETLSTFVDAKAATTIDALKNDPEFSGDLRDTAMTIISAYYVGFAGTPRPGHAQDDTVFITYTQALMYQVTYEHTPIPSYARWGTGYWSSLTNPT